MIRNIIHIDEEKCNGCALCVNACQEGAIELIDGKAKLMRDDYCDGLGNCLPACPTGAISFITREAAAFDEKAVEEHMKRKAMLQEPPACGCPGSSAKKIERTQTDCCSAPAPENARESQLTQWPVQIKLAAPNASFFHNADLLIAADCTAYAYGDFHNRFMKNKVTLIGCPKLDTPDYSEKLTAILSQNDIKSVTVARMEVPCCGGIVKAVTTAMQNSGKIIPWQIVTISSNGKILD